MVPTGALINPNERIMAGNEHTNNGNVRSHFDAQAGDYVNRWTRWPWSAIRNREADIIRKLLGRIDDLDALDLGCGAGFYTRVLLELGARQVTSVDISPAMLGELPKERVTPRQADAQTVTFDEPFRVILCAGLLEFVSDPVRVLKNAHQAAASDGRMVILVPAANIVGSLYRLYHRRHNVSATLFDPSTLQEAARLAGWSIDRMEKAGAMAIAAELTRQPESVSS